MKDAQKLIKNTINMIDEYEAKADEINKRGQKFDAILWWIVLPIILITMLTFFYVLRLGE